MPKLTEGTGLSSSPFANMLVGETLTHTFKSGRTMTITRTNRPFQFDWHDASNNELAVKGSNFRWMPEHGGEGFKLVDIRFVDHPDTSCWRPSPEEKGEAEREVSWALDQGMTMHEFKDYLACRGQRKAA